jgi:diacylglycerol kinase family enzyme
MRALLVVNPKATTVSARGRDVLARALASDLKLDLVETLRRNHAIEIGARAVDEAYDLVVVLGGDGTVNEVVNGLQRDGPRTDQPALAVVPGGSTNVFHRALEIPRDPVEATGSLLDAIREGRSRWIGLGKADQRWFTFTAGLGLDASVVKHVDERPALKSRMGAFYFTAAAVTTFTRDYWLNPPKLEVRTDDGEVHRGVTAIIQNGDPFTYFNNRPIVAAEGARLDSGDLSGVMLERATPLDVPGIAVRALAQGPRLLNHRRISGFSGAREITAVSLDGRPVPLQVDGDYIGDVTEATYGIAPQALSVVA